MSEGAAIVRASWWGTGVFVTAAVSGVLSESLQGVALAVDVVLFALGCGAFLWALVVAAGRSRQVEMGIGGLFFLAGSAPVAARRALLTPLAIQVVVAFVSAGLRPFTPLAGGMLVPVFGLGCAGLWGARFGQFSPRRMPTQH